jgi:transcriptional regulator with XRE-family HTH domain
MATFYEKFGEKVKKLRKDQNMSQEKLAELINRDPRTVVAVEAGKRNATIKTIYKIAKALQTTPSKLLEV